VKAVEMRRHLVKFSPTNAASPERRIIGAKDVFLGLPMWAVLTATLWRRL